MKHEQLYIATSGQEEITDVIAQLKTRGYTVDPGWTGTITRYLAKHQGLTPLWVMLDPVSKTVVDVEHGVSNHRLRVYPAATFLHNVLSYNHY